MRLPAQTKDGRWSTISILAYVQNATIHFRAAPLHGGISILAYVQNATCLAGRAIFSCSNFNSRICAECDGQRGGARPHRPEFQFSHMCRMRLLVLCQLNREVEISILAYVQNATGRHALTSPAMFISILAYVQNATLLIVG